MVEKILAYSVTLIDPGQFARFKNKVIGLDEYGTFKGGFWAIAHGKEEDQLLVYCDVDGEKKALEIVGVCKKRYASSRELFSDPVALFSEDEEKELRV
jgi:hypothetical protein